MAHHSGTDTTSISYENGVFVVIGMGGYDGYLKQEFEDIEDAMDFVASLWKLNTGRDAFQKRIVEFDKTNVIKRHIRKAFGG